MKLVKIVLVATVFLFANQAAHAALGEMDKDEVPSGKIYCAEKQRKIDRQAVAAASANQDGQPANTNSAL